MNRRTLVRLAVAIAAIAALLVAGRRAGVVVLRFAAWVEGLGGWGPAAFAVGYVLCTVALVPGSLLTLAAGALFGLVRGTALAFGAATVGACAAFLLARSLARRAVERRLGGSPRLAAIDRAVAREGWIVVLLLRLSPVFPFVLLNYALGLTRVRFRDYALASIGMLPGTVLYVYYGTLARSVVGLAGAAPVRRDAGYWIVLALGLVATLAVTTVVTRTARRALARATDASAETPHAG